MPGFWKSVLGISTERRSEERRFTLELTKLLDRVSMSLPMDSACHFLTTTLILLYARKRLSMIRLLGSPRKRFNESQRIADWLLSQYRGLDFRATTTRQTIGDSPRMDWRFCFKTSKSWSA